MTHVSIELIPRTVKAEDERPRWMHRRYDGWRGGFIEVEAGSRRAVDTASDETLRTQGFGTTDPRRRNHCVKTDLTVLSKRVGVDKRSRSPVCSLMAVRSARRIRNHSCLRAKASAVGKSVGCEVHFAGRLYSVTSARSAVYEAKTYHCPLSVAKIGPL